MEAALTLEARVQCEGTSKRTGERCTAPVVGGTQLCAGHSGRGIAANPMQGSLASAKARSARVEARKRGFMDVLEAEVAANQDALVRRWVKIALRGDDAVANAALERITTRLLGRPLERVELADMTGVPIEKLDETGVKALEQRVLRLVDTQPEGETSSLTSTSDSAHMQGNTTTKGDEPKP